MNKYYAGIGARETPDEVCEIMQRLAKWLAEEGWVLRSGGAIGADSAFEAGCDLVDGEKEIFLPIPFYNQIRARLLRHLKKPMHWWIPFGRIILKEVLERGHL